MAITPHTPHTPLLTLLSSHSSPHTPHCTQHDDSSYGDNNDGNDNYDGNDDNDNRRYDEAMEVIETHVKSEEAPNADDVAPSGGAQKISLSKTTRKLKAVVKAEPEAPPQSFSDMKPELPRRAAGGWRWRR